MYISDYLYTRILYKKKIILHPQRVVNVISTYDYITEVECNVREVKCIYLKNQLLVT